MNTRNGLAASALLLLLFAAPRLAGQVHRSFREEFDLIQQQSKLRLGPVRLVPVFRLTDVGYDSNVYFSADGRETVSDATATLSPELRAAWLAGPSLILTATENPEFLFYAKELALRTFTNSFSGGLRWLALRRFSISAEYHSWSHVRRSLSELDRRIRDTTSGAAGSFFFETPRGTALGVSGAVDDFRYLDIASGAPDDVYGRTLDRRETRLSAEAHFRVFTRSYLSATVGWGRYDFRHAESAWRDGSSIEALAGFRFPLVGRARGAVSLGWKSFRPDTAEREPFSGLVARTEVGVRLGRVAVTLGFDRDNAFSYNESAYYYLDSRLRAGLALYLLPGLRLDGGVQYSAMAFPEPQEVWDGGTFVVVERRRDDQWGFSAGPVVRISGAVGLGLTYNAYRRTSNAPGFDVRRSFIGAFITYEF
jgi:hypothetical protein